MDVEKLLAAIEETERMYIPDEPEDELDFVIPKDEELHTLACAKYMTGQNANCSCSTPSDVLRRCAADREEVELHAVVWRVGVAVTRETMSGFAAAAERASAAARRLRTAVLGNIPQEVWDYLREGEGS